MEETKFRRQVIFEPGYNYLHETGPKRRGQHGMSIRFLLHGPHGSTQFLLGTGWTPLGQVDEGLEKTESVHIDYWQESHYSGFNHKFGLVNPPMGADLGYHWRTPAYEGQSKMEGKCNFLGGADCYYDGSGLMADTVLRDFIKNGERAVWHHLVQRYRWCLDDMAQMGVGV